MLPLLFHLVLLALLLLAALLATDLRPLLLKGFQAIGELLIELPLAALFVGAAGCDLL